MFNKKICLHYRSIQIWNGISTTLAYKESKVSTTKTNGLTNTKNDLSHGLWNTVQTYIVI